MINACYVIDPPGVLKDQQVVLGEGLYDVVKLKYLVSLGTLVAVKFVMGPEATINREAWVMSVLDGNVSLPYFYGVTEPKSLIMQFIGSFDCANEAPLTRSLTMHQQTTKKTSTQHDWAIHSSQIYFNFARICKKSKITFPK